MSDIQFFLLVVSLVLLASVQGEEICDLKDVECLTKSASNVYKLLIPGVKDITKPIDPLYIQKIDGEILGLNYEIKNASLSGLRNCEVSLLKFDLEAMVYEYHLQCPKLELDYYYKIKGALGPLTLDGSGLGLNTIDDYLLIFKGNYSKFISEEDKSLRMSISNYNLETDLKGKFIFESKHLIQGDKEKIDLAKAYINDNYKAMENIFRPNVLDKFMASLIKETDTYLRSKPLVELIKRT